MSSRPRRTRRKLIRTCFDRILDADAMVDTRTRVAVNENVSNVPILPPDMFSFGGFGGPQPLELAVVTNVLWKPGKVLRCRFLDGHPTVQDKVVAVAKQWEQFANIKLAFGDDPEAEVRIAFIDGAGSWSYLGTDALGIPKDKPTMNYGWLRLNTPNIEYERTVLHEFGHALGCIHEHQNPATNIPWDKPAVYRYYAGPPNFWSKEKVDINLFKKYSENITQFSEFDRQSIMLYPINNQLTIGDYEVGWNRALSDTDKTFINTIYPFEEKSVKELVLDGPAVEDTIGEHGEEDTFSFRIATAGNYTVETEGRTDVTMGLFGPNDQTVQVAADDDSGLGLNAKINTALEPGEYTVRIRHYRPRGKGAYKVVLKRG